MGVVVETFPEEAKEPLWFLLAPLFLSVTSVTALMRRTLSLSCSFIQLIVQEQQAAVRDAAGSNSEPHLCYRLVSDWSDRCDITVSCVDLRGEAVTVRQTEGEAAVCLCVL